MAFSTSITLKEPIRVISSERVAIRSLLRPCLGSKTCPRQDRLWIICSDKFVDWAKKGLLREKRQRVNSDPAKRCQGMMKLKRRYWMQCLNIH